MIWQIIFKCQGLNWGSFACFVNGVNMSSFLKTDDDIEGPETNQILSSCHVSQTITVQQKAVCNGHVAFNHTVF